METCFTQFIVKELKRNISIAINLLISFLIILYPLPSVEGDSETEEREGGGRKRQKERGRSDDDGARTRAGRELAI